MQERHDRGGYERGQDNKQGSMDEYHHQLYRRPQMTGQEEVKNPWVHGLNKSRVPSHNDGTIYRVAIKRLICHRAVAPSFAQRNRSITQIHQSRSVNIASVAKYRIIYCFFPVKNKGQYTEKSGRTKVADWQHVSAEKSTP